jgi:hypothetical protein
LAHSNGAADLPLRTERATGASTIKGAKRMPQIIPIRDLKKTSELSTLCRQSGEPVFITKNGYGDMVIMSMETYEKTLFVNDTYRKLEEGEGSIHSGAVMDGFASLKAIREKHGL